jgi:hypothetical protein
MRTYSDRRAILIGPKSKYLLDYTSKIRKVENRISNTT